MPRRKSRMGVSNVMAFPEELLGINKPHYNGTANLIPVRTKEEAKERGRNGGLAGKGSPAKSLACKLREMKKKGVHDDTIEWLHNSMVSDELSKLNILTWLRGMQATAKTQEDKVKYARLLIDFHKITHGTKETTHTVDIESREYKFSIEMRAPKEVDTVLIKEVVLEEKKE
jgi:hypothetical protein